MPKNVLLLKAGEAANALRLVSGDYERWFFRAAGLTGYRFEVVNAHLGQRLPAPSGYDAVVMTGSPLSMTAPSDWMKRAAEHLRSAADRRVPVLGVCFGHQLLGYAFGSRVIRNPRGREIGSVEVRLTPAGQADPLFRSLPERFLAQATHEDIVERPPPGATVLAHNDNTALQAMAIGRHVRGVQFHPELFPDGLRALICSRAAALQAESPHQTDRVSQLLAGIRPTPHGRTVLLNFLRAFT